MIEKPVFCLDPRPPAPLGGPWGTQPNYLGKKDSYS